MNDGSNTSSNGARPAISLNVTLTSVAIVVAIIGIWLQQNSAVRQSDQTAAALCGDLLHRIHQKDPRPPGPSLSTAVLDYGRNSQCARELTGAQLQHCDLECGEFVDFTIERSNFSDANLAGVTLDRSTFDQCDFTRADFGLHSVMPPLTLTETSTSAPDCLFKNCNFQGADLSFVDFSRSVFVDTSFAGARLSRTTFKGADLRRARGLSEDQVRDVLADAETRWPIGFVPPPYK